MSRKQVRCPSSFCRQMVFLDDSGQYGHHINVHGKPCETIGMEWADPVDLEVERRRVKDAADARYRRVVPNPAFIADGEETLAPVDYLIDGVVPTEGAGQTWGESDVGKTFKTLSMDVAIAAGRPWFGHDVKHGTVVYYAFEGGRAFAIRKHAAKGAAGLGDARIYDDPLPFITVRERFDPGHAAALRKYAAERGWPPIRKVTLDTLSQHMEGDQDSNTDMSRFLQGFRAFLGAVSDEPCFGHFLHHPGHNNKNRAKGASALPADLDLTMQLAGPKDRLLLTCDRMRDDERFDPIGLRLDKVLVTIAGEPLVDSRGRRVSTLVTRSREAKGETTGPRVDEFTEAVFVALPAYPTKVGIRGDNGILARVKAATGKGSYDTVAAAVVRLKDLDRAEFADGRKAGSLVWGRTPERPECL